MVVASKFVLNSPQSVHDYTRITSFSAMPINNILSNIASALVTITLDVYFGDNRYVVLNTSQEHHAVDKTKLFMEKRYV